MTAIILCLVVKYYFEGKLTKQYTTRVSNQRLRKRERGEDTES